MHSIASGNGTPEVVRTSQYVKYKISKYSPVVKIFDTQKTEHSVCFMFLDYEV